MDAETKKNLTEQSTWKRIAYMVLFVITLNLAEAVLAVVVLLQIVFKLLTGKPLDGLVELGRDIADYLKEIVNFLTFASEEMPFPVGPWPNASAGNAPPPAKDDGMEPA